MRAICVFFFQAEDGIRDVAVTGVQTCALPISGSGARDRHSHPGPASIDSAGSSRCRAAIPMWWRSEERRVGKEGRFRWSPYHYKKKDNIQKWYTDQPRHSIRVDTCIDDQRCAP